MNNCNFDIGQKFIGRENKRLFEVVDKTKEFSVGTIREVIKIKVLNKKPNEKEFIYSNVTYLQHLQIDLI